MTTMQTWAIVAASIALGFYLGVHVTGAIAYPGGMSTVPEWVSIAHRAKFLAVIVFFSSIMAAVAIEVEGIQ